MRFARMQWSLTLESVRLFKSKLPSVSFVYCRSSRNARPRVTHTNTNILQISNNYFSTNMAPIDDALESLKSLKLGEKPNLTLVADKYGCNRSTLSKRWRGIQGSVQQKNENQRLLNKTQEKELILYIDGLTARGLPPTRQMIRNFASDIAGRQAGKTWAD